MSELASVGEFCPNDQCSDAGKTDADNMIRYGKTGNGRQRYRCKTCGKTFSETTGTIFSGKHTPKDEIIETLAFVAEGVRVASLSRVKGYKESTIRNWLQQAAEHAEEVENALMSEYEIDQGQLDGLWTYVGENDKKENAGEENAGEENVQKKTSPATRIRLERFGEWPRWRQRHAFESDTAWPEAAWPEAREKPQRQFSKR